MSHNNVTVIYFFENCTQSLLAYHMHHTVLGVYNNIIVVDSSPSTLRTSRKAATSTVLMSTVLDQVVYYSTPKYLVLQVRFSLLRQSSYGRVSLPIPVVLRPVLTVNVFLPTSSNFWLCMRVGFIIIFLPTSTLEGSSIHPSKQPDQTYPQYSRTAWVHQDYFYR
jgi:hypothetical protein